MDYGVLRDKNDVKLLILYILRTAKQPVTLSDITDIIMDGGNANYFDFSDALNQLLSIGHMEYSRDEEEEKLTITQLGLDTIEMFEKRLPYSVREKTMKIVIQALTKIKTHSELFCDIQENGGGCSVTCGIRDLEDILFKVTVTVPNRMQAEIIAKRFQDNPDYIYKNIILLLTEDSNPI